MSIWWAASLNIHLKITVYRGGNLLINNTLFFSLWNILEQVLALAGGTKGKLEPLNSNAVCTIQGS